MKSIFIPDSQVFVRAHVLPGEGIPLVFIHGLGCASSCDYVSIVRDPQLSHRAAVLIDLLGSGFSDKPVGFTYSIAEHASTVATVINALGIGDFDLFGHSMGGAVAIEVASRLSNRIKHLILSEPNLDAGGGMFSLRIAALSEADYITHGHNDIIDEASSTGSDIWAGSMAASAPFAVHRTSVSLIKGGSPSWREQLITNTSNRTLIFGEQSLPDPDTTFLPQFGINIAVVPNASHSMAWENPSGLAAAIASACH